MSLEIAGRDLMSCLALRTYKDSRRDVPRLDLSKLFCPFSFIQLFSRFLLFSNAEVIQIYPRATSLASVAIE